MSKREKSMLTFLLILLFLLGYYKYVYVKQRNKVVLLKGEKKNYELKMEEVNNFKITIPKKEGDIKIINSKIKDKSESLYPAIVQENIIMELDDLMKKSSVTGSITFSEIEVKPFEEKSSKEDKKNGTNFLKPVTDEYAAIEGEKKDEHRNKKVDNNGDKTSKAGNIDQMKLSLSVKGSYLNIINFIKSIESHPKKIAISKLNMSQSTVNEVNAAITLEIYAVPKIGEEDIEYFNWIYNNNYGKTNPFDGSAQTSSKTIEDLNKEKDAYDFVMSVKPINSDLPTIMLGKSKDENRNTYVYADNSSQENIQLILSEKDGKYYYKYKTSRNSYPLNFNGEGIEFSPVTSNIVLKILSSKRLSEEDKASAKLNIKNNTSKSVIVNIESDDETSSRITISGEGGNVDIRRN